MEELFNALKELILNEFNDNLEQSETDDLKLSKVKANGIVFGSLDIQKFTNDVIVSFYPESSEEEEENIDGENVEANIVTIGIICKGDKYENLIKKICRYTQCFKETLIENYSMGGLVKNINFGNIKYFPDAGNIEKTVTATETELTIYTKSKYF